MDTAIQIAVATNNIRLLRSALTPETLTKEIQNDLQKTLYELSISGAVTRELFQYLIKFVNINEGNEQNRTPLHLAAFYGHLHVVEILVDAAKEQSIDIDRTTSTGCTATYFASCRGFLLILEVLLKAGSNPNISTKSLSTPLIAASLKGHYDIVNLLLKYQANSNLKNTKGMTAMHAAACNGYHDILQLLQKHGGDITLVDNDNRTSLDILQSKITLSRTPTNNTAPILNNNKSSSRESTEDTTVTGSNSTSSRTRPSQTDETKNHYVKQNNNKVTHTKSSPSWRCTNFKTLLCYSSNSLNNDFLTQQV